MPDQSETERHTRPPTIRDVAERAGVSKSLVSLVLRESDRVSETSRTAVLAAIDDLGYRPSAVARSLVNRRSGLMGIITSGARDAFHADVVEGVSSYINASKRGLIPLILYSDHAEAHETRVADRFLELRVESLILMGSAQSDTALEGYGRVVPTATVGRYVDSPLIDVVVNDDARGAELATRHLLELGHRRIAHITGGAGNGAREREASFRRTMAEAGCEPIVVPGTYLQEGGREGARRLQDHASGLPTAVFAANDLCAIGAMDVFKSAGLAIPDDISIVGYDDIPFAGLRAIDLTTINQPAFQMGETAARLLCERVGTGSTEGTTVLIEPALVVRSTTRAL
jgi:DNA-binding LacI/PurR family transcriptional regulator